MSECVALYNSYLTEYWDGSALGAERAVFIQNDEKSVPTVVIKYRRSSAYRLS
jgi:hypothetical protein